MYDVTVCQCMVVCALVSGPSVMVIILQCSLHVCMCMCLFHLYCICVTRLHCSTPYSCVSVQYVFAAPPSPCQALCGSAPPYTEQNPGLWQRRGQGKLDTYTRQLQCLQRYFVEFTRDYVRSHCTITQLCILCTSRITSSLSCTRWFLFSRTQMTR